jgi:hypothetical protein
MLIECRSIETSKETKTMKRTIKKLIARLEYDCKVAREVEDMHGIVFKEASPGFLSRQQARSNAVNALKELLPYLPEATKGSAHRLDELETRIERLENRIFDDPLSPQRRPRP